MSFKNLFFALLIVTTLTACSKSIDTPSDQVNPSTPNAAQADPFFQEASSPSTQGSPSDSPTATQASGADTPASDEQILPDRSNIEAFDQSVLETENKEDCDQFPEESRFYSNCIYMHGGLDEQVATDEELLEQEG